MNLNRTMLALLVAIPALAAVPPTIDQQGRLLKLDGTPETGSIGATFALYDVATGGTALWTEKHTLKLDASGFYAATLGSVTAFGGVWDGRSLFLGLTLDGESEMAPRQGVMSVPYALKAGVTDDAVGDIHPTSITVGGKTIVDSTGTVLVQGPAGVQGVKGDTGPQGPAGPPTQPTLSCLYRYAASATGTSSYAVGSTVRCITGEVMTGGTCVVATGSAGTAGLFASDGSGIYFDCIPSNNGDNVTAQAVCCKIAF